MTLTVIIPLVQSVITGLLAGLLAVVLLRLANVQNPGMLALAAGLAVTLGRWLPLARRALHVYELATGADLDLDGAIGEPETDQNQPNPTAQAWPPAQLQPAPVRVVLETPDQRHTSIIDLPGKPDQVQALARGLLAGDPLTHAHWTGAGQPFSRAEFEQLRGELIRRGLATWRNQGNRANGAELTPAGRAVMRRLAGQ